jgi:hypothetical protein
MNQSLSGAKARSDGFAIVKSPFNVAFVEGKRSRIGQHFGPRDDPWQRQVNFPADQSGQQIDDAEFSSHLIPPFELYERTTSSVLQVRSGDKMRAAPSCGLSLSTLYRKLEKLASKANLYGHGVDYAS